MLFLISWHKITRNGLTSYKNQSINKIVQYIISSHKFIGANSKFTENHRLSSEDMS